MITKALGALAILTLALGSVGLGASSALAVGSGQTELAITGPSSGEEQPTRTFTVSGTATPGATVIVTVGTYAQGVSTTLASTTNRWSLSFTDPDTPENYDYLTVKAVAPGLTAKYLSLPVLFPPVAGPQLVATSPANGSTVIGKPTRSGLSDNAMAIEIDGLQGVGREIISLRAVNTATGEPYVAPDALHLNGGSVGPKFGFDVPRPAGFWYSYIDLPVGTWSITAAQHQTGANDSPGPDSPASEPIVITVAGPAGFVPAPSLTQPTNGSTVEGTPSAKAGVLTVPISGTGVPGDIIRLHADSEPAFSNYARSLYGENTLPSGELLIGDSTAEAFVPKTGDGVVVAANGTWTTTVALKPGAAGVYAFQFAPSSGTIANSLAPVSQFTVAAAAVTSTPSPTATMDPGGSSEAAGNAGTELAFTGSSPAGAVLGAGLLFLVGGAALVIARRRRTRRS